MTFSTKWNLVSILHTFINVNLTKIILTLIKNQLNKLLNEVAGICPDVSCGYNMGENVTFTLLEVVKVGGVVVNIG